MTTDVVVPAHNEAETIEAVVSAIRSAPSVGQVVVVADKCTDATDWLAQTAGASVVQSWAHDKGTAMAYGLEEVASDRVLFCDADLVGLRPAHIEAMLTAPPLNGQLVGVVGGSLAGILPPISGQRRLPTALARSVPLVGSGWRAETFLNVAVARAGLPRRHVRLAGVSNPSKAPRAPLAWLEEVGRVAAVSVAFLPELARYTLGGSGAMFD